MTTTEPPAAARQRPKPMSMPRQRLYDEMADLTRFSLRVVRDVPAARRYLSEVFRQAGLVIISSALVMWFMELMLGLVLAVHTHYLFRQMGAASYVGATPAIFATRGAAATMWGWILAAKVGCGFAAEIGSMRIGEEIDAMEVIGIRSRVYLVTTRIVGAFIAMPFLFAVGLLLAFGGAFIMNVRLLHTVSQGGFFSILWSFQNTADLTFAILWALIVSIVVVLVACYFGYTAKGGPVGVGLNTAKSMLVNMVLISVLAMVLVQLIYGNNPNAPIAN